MEELPIVNFGKYKDQSVLELLKDENYTNWLKQQSWFGKHKQIYNIVIHQTNQTSNNSKTPEHNKLQNLFLDKNNQLKLVNTIFSFNSFKKSFDMLIKDEKFISTFDSTTLYMYNANDDSYINQNLFEWIVPEFNRNVLNHSHIIFEEKNWDFKLKFSDDYWIVFGTKDGLENLTENYLYDIMAEYGFKKRDGFEFATYISKENEKYIVQIRLKSFNPELFCELKPVLSDDYPCVLRKLKNQIQLTTNNKNARGMFFLLIIGSFTSDSTTKEQLFEIFKQSDIKVLFTDELFKSPEIKSICDFTDSKSHIDLIKENKVLIEKIKQLEDEIILLKLKNNIN
jgi:hypothetical protein